jgi:hypothetical protein
MAAGGRARGRRRDDDGSVLLLYPVGVLIVIIFGAIAADLSHVHMVRRDLIELSGTLANDLATAGLDQDHYRRNERYRLSPGLSQRVMANALGVTDLGPVTARVSAVGPGGSANPTLIDAADQPVGECDPDPVPCRVRVTLDAHVDYIFGAALPGSRGADLSVTSYATLEEG